MTSTERWMKEEQYVEIEHAVTGTGSVLIIASNIPWELLPLEFKEAVPENDTLRCCALYDTVCSWAGQRGFHPASDA